MSTIITPAYRVEPGANVFVLAVQLSKLLKPVLYHEAMLNVLTDAVCTYDNRLFQQKTPVDSFQVVFNKQVGFTEPDELRAWFVFLYNQKRDETFVLFRSIPHSALQVAEKVPGIGSEYSYWDSSDSQLEHMSHEEWLERRAVWEETVGSGSLDVAGLRQNVFQSYEKEPYFSAEVEYLATIAGEVRDMVRVNRLLPTVWVEALKNVGITMTFEDIMSMVSGWMLSGGDHNRLPYVTEHPELLRQCEEKVSLLVQQNPVHSYLSDR